jgi:hypothetical protein
MHQFGMMQALRVQVWLLHVLVGDGLGGDGWHGMVFFWFDVISGRGLFEFRLENRLDKYTYACDLT